MAITLLKNCTLLDAALPDPREGYDVLIEGERIREISDRPLHTSTAAQTLDLKGQILMPGLTDAHVHATLVEVNLGAIQNLPATLIAVRAARNLEQMLERGFTTVRDAGGADWGLAAAVAQGYIKGPRLLFSGHALSQTGGHGDFRARTLGWDGCACHSFSHAFSRVVDGVDAMRRAVREELRRGASQIKIMVSGGVASPTDQIGHTQYALDEIRAAVEEAQAAGTYVMAHAYGPNAIRRAVEQGVRSIEHGNLVDQTTAEAMATRGAFMVPTLVTYETLFRHGAEMGLPPESRAKLGDVREAGLRALELCRAAGVPIGHGSDLLGDLHRYQALEFSLKAEVLTPHEVITAATRTNAALFNLAGEIGELTVGARADLLAVAGNPLLDLNLLQEGGRHFTLIMKDGVVYKTTL
jgi:imidazolonepropionase-like amidohydrolase